MWRSTRPVPAAHSAYQIRSCNLNVKPAMRRSRDEAQEGKRRGEASSVDPLEQSLERRVTINGARLEHDPRAMLEREDSDAATAVVRVAACLQDARGHVRIGTVEEASTNVVGITVVRGQHFTDAATPIDTDCGQETRKYWISRAEGAELLRGPPSRDERLQPCAWCVAGQLSAYACEIDFQNKRSVCGGQQVPSEVCQQILYELVGCRQLPEIRWQMTVTCCWAHAMKGARVDERPASFVEPFPAGAGNIGCERMSASAACQRVLLRGQRTVGGPAVLRRHTRVWRSAGGCSSPARLT